MRRPSRSWIEALAVALILCLMGPSAATAAGWREVAPLPEPRWFHVAATDLEGRVYAFAGKLLTETGASRYGLKEFALRIYDPHTNRWLKGPPSKGLKAQHRSTAAVRHAGDIVSDPIQVKVHLREVQKALPHEVPQGAGGRDGRIYWFAWPGPVIFDPKQDAWVQDHLPMSDNRTGGWLTPVPRLIRHGAVTATAPDGRIFTVGGLGYPLLPQERSKDSQKLYALLDSVEVYDPVAHTWEERAPLRRPRQLFAGTFGADGRLYVFGGYGHRGVVRRHHHASDAAFEQAVAEMDTLGRNALRSVEIYDPATDTWSQGAPMPVGRHAMGAALGADGRIYVVGGARSYSDPVPTREVFVYDPAADRWSRGPSLRHGRYHHAVAATRDGKIYAVGGMVRSSDGKRGSARASVEVLDTSAPAPEPKPAPPDRG